MTDAQRTHEIIRAAIAVHREPGPGLSIQFARQKPIPVVCKNAKLDCGYPAEAVVADRVIVASKAIAAFIPIHAAAMLNYLRLSGYKIGLLINCHSAVLKEGMHRQFGSTMFANSSTKTKPRGEEVAENATKKNTRANRQARP